MKTFYFIMYKIMIQRNLRHLGILFSEKLLNYACIKYKSSLLVKCRNLPKLM